jgi:hypothetical protein
MSLKENLIGAVQKYLKANDSALAFFKGMGKEGKLRAEEYLGFLQKTELEEHTLYYTVLTHIQSKLGSSTNLRNDLASALCVYRNISKQDIERETETIFSRNISMNGFVIKAHDDCKTEAMVTLLVKQPTLAPVPTTPSPTL